MYREEYIHWEETVATSDVVPGLEYDALCFSFIRKTELSLKAKQTAQDITETIFD